MVRGDMVMGELLYHLVVVLPCEEGCSVGCGKSE